MKPLEHTFHILGNNRIILIPVFFNSIITLTITSYVFNIIKPDMDPLVFLQNIETTIPKFFWLMVISGILVLFVEAFFTSMTLSMIYEAWKKGRTKIDFSYGAKFFYKLLGARIIFLPLLLLLATPLISLAVVTPSPSAAILAYLSLFLLVIYVLSFFWINEAIVTKKTKILKAFSVSKTTTFKNIPFTIMTALMVAAIYLVTQSVVNTVSLSNQIFPTTLVALLATILAKTLISTLKLVSFLQTK